MCACTAKFCVTVRTYHCEPPGSFDAVCDSDDGYGGSELGYAQCSAATGGECYNGLRLRDLCYLQGSIENSSTEEGEGDEKERVVRSSGRVARNRRTG